MATKKVWNHMFVAGNPKMFKKVRSSSENPMLRSEALEDAKMAGDKGWRSWVEHSVTGERIYESETEKAFKSAQEEIEQ